MRAPERYVVPSSQGTPTTATSASARVGATRCGALRKVAMPLKGSSSVVIYFTPLACAALTSATHSSTMSQPRAKSSGG